MQKRLTQIEKQIEKIKIELQQIGKMRPGSLTEQYKIPKEKKGAYYQLSYTHERKSRTEYIRPQFVKEIRRQIKVYKLFKNLTEKWIKLSIEYSRLSMNVEAKKSRKM